MSKFFPVQLKQTFGDDRSNIELQHNYYFAVQTFMKCPLFNLNYVHKLAKNCNATSVSKLKVKNSEEVHFNYDAFLEQSVH